MRATVIHAPRDIRVEERDAPVLIDPTDAVVKVTAACVCGSDLWPYRGVRDTKEPRAIGHEFVGVVESVGADVTDLSVATSSSRRSRRTTAPARPARTA